MNSIMDPIGRQVDGRVAVRGATAGNKFYVGVAD
jgi:hypothetical protein